MQIFHSGRLLPMLMVGAVLQACSSAPAVNTASQNSLNAVQETSGLVCDNQGLWTINDSGNGPNIYQVDPQQSRITQTIATNADNLDWEALTIQDNRLIIADIGNNSGKRQDISLYVLTWPAQAGKTAKTQRIDIAYPAGPIGPLQPYQHNLDAEALAASPDGLFLFSKNWLADSSTVYRVDLQQPALTVHAEISGLPGMLTDASWAAQSQLFVATGYRNIRKHGVMFALTGDFQPFLAFIDRQFKVIKVLPLDTQGQVEGVCVDKQQQIWLSQEQSDHHPAKFWRWGTVPIALAQQ